MSEVCKKVKLRSTSNLVVLELELRVRVPLNIARLSLLTKLLSSQ